MKTTPIAIWLPLLFAALGVFWYLAAAVLKLIVPAVEDLSLFARPVNMKALGALTDPAEEARLRASLSASEFRKAQRKSTFAALEQFRRILHNAGLFLNHANIEFKKMSSKHPATYDDHDQAVIQVIRCAMEVKKCTWRAVIKSVLWIVLRVDYWVFLPSPSLSDLRQSLGVDILGAYCELVGLIGQLTLRYGPTQHDKIMSAL